ncbi:MULTISPECIES: XisI protein [unclassified Microcoleus]|uniref:XisI protein n=1 Tax=unclassified Microcoleus TaxID=2642155 RepID=UPI002FD74026
MANIEVYREYVQAILKKYESYQSENDPIASQIIFDTERDHYQLVHVGWRDWRRYYGCVVHIDIQDGKIWIQHDGTEIGVANELVDLGVPKQDIVLAFQAPYKRKYTEFAIG